MITIHPHRHNLCKFLPAPQKKKCLEPFHGTTHITHIPNPHTINRNETYLYMRDKIILQKRYCYAIRIIQSRLVKERYKKKEKKTLRTGEYVLKAEWSSNNGNNRHNIF